MGFSAQEYLNNDAASAYLTLPAKDVMIIANHGGPGRIRLDTSKNGLTRLFATSFTSIPSTSRAISDYPSNGLSNTKLAIFLGCETGLTDDVFGNLVDKAIEKGAFCSMGWTEEIHTSEANPWIAQYIYQCYLGNDLGDALLYTKAWATEQGYSSSINNIYYGSSRLFATVLG